MQPSKGSSRSARDWMPVQLASSFYRSNGVCGESTRCGGDFSKDGPGYHG
jgi:hypothetical protein